VRQIFGLVMTLALWAFSASALAQEREVTVTSQEVVERLIRLEEGQKALAQRLEDVNTGLNKRIDDTNKRIDDLRAEMRGRIDDLRVEMGGRIDNTNQRIDDLRADMNARFGEVMILLQIIISALVALVLAIAGAGFIMWRKILSVDAAVQTKIGLDQAVREQVTRLEQEIGFVKGKLRELSEAIERR